MVYSVHEYLTFHAHAYETCMWIMYDKCIKLLWVFIAISWIKTSSVVYSWQYSSHNRDSKLNALEFISILQATFELYLQPVSILFDP